MTALRFRCHPVAAEAALRTASRRIESIHTQVAETMRSLRSIAVLKTSVNSAVVRWSDMAVRKELGKRRNCRSSRPAWRCWPTHPPAAADC